MAKKQFAGFGGLVLAVSTAACGVLPGAAGVSGLAGGVPGAGAVGGSPGQAKSSPEALAALTRTLQNDVANCERNVDMADKKLAEALGKLAAKKPSDLVAKVRKEKVTLTLDVASPQMPIPIVKDSLMEEGQKLPNPATTDKDKAAVQAFAKRSMAVQPALTPLRDQVNAVGGALTSAHGAGLQCAGPAKATSRTFIAMERGGDTITPEMHELHARLLQGNARYEAIFGSMVGLIGTYQAAFAGKDPKAVDVVADAIAKAKPSEVKVTEADATAALKEAAAEIPADPTPSPAAQAKTAPAPKADASTVRRLIPDDSQAAVAMDGLTALKDGDYKSAVKNAAKLIPPSVPVAGALANVLGSLL